MRSRIFKIEAMLVAACIAGPALLAQSGDLFAAPKEGGTLVIGMTQKPRHLNPAVQSGIATAVPGTQIFATPLRFDENWNPQPYLAESWEVSDDGLSVTLKLREAKFHDGKPITSEDLAFSLMTVKENHPFKAMFAPVTAVDTPDARTAVIKLEHPHPAILLAMSSALLAVIPKHVYGDGQDPKSHPANSQTVGSGAYKLVEFKPGEHIIMERNPDYFMDEGPYMDRIIVRTYKDATSLALAADKGDVDMYPFLAAARDIKRLNDNGDLIVTNQGYAAVGPINWLAFNTKHEVLKDKKVRQAIAYALDRNFVVNALQGGASTPATGPIANDSPFYTADIETYDVDLDKAASLLDEAGHPVKDGTRFALTIDYIPGLPEQQKSIAEYLRSQLKKIGIDITVRSAPDFPTWAKRVSNHEFDLTMDVVFNWGDPVIGVHRTYLCSNIKVGVIWSNTQSYCNPKVDELLDKASKETDQDKRQALYKEFQQIVVDEVPLTYVNLLPYHTAYSKKLGNPPLSIWGTMAPLDQVYWQE
ncbi:MAG: ABC transporter substrate-binding protein [Kiloniellales bacterium]|nr:ABC transporter substrate-binding protein [Kiloniellales bacterium]